MICKSDHRNGKYCPMCKAVRPLEEFNKCSRNRDGHARLCREHDRERQQALYSIRNADKPRRKYVRAEDKKPASHARTCARPGCGKVVIGHVLKLYCSKSCREKKWHDDHPAQIITDAQVRRLEGLDRPKAPHVCDTSRFGYCVPCRLAEIRKGRNQKVHLTDERTRNRSRQDYHGKRTQITAAATSGD